MKSLHMTIETQTEDEDLLSLIFINEKFIALETSDVARIIKKKNEKLFNKINRRTEINKGLIYRRESTSRGNDLTRLGSIIHHGGNFKELEVARLIFNNNSLKKQSRIKTSAGNKIDFFPDSLKVFKGKTILDHENLTQDDIDSSTILNESMEISIDIGGGIKCFMFKDFAVDRESLQNISYRVVFEVNTYFENYIRFVLKEIDQSIFFLQSMLNNINSSGHYDTNTFTFNEKYLEQLYSSIGVGLESGKINVNSDRLKSSEFGKAGLAFHNGRLLLEQSVRPEVYKNFVVSIIPSNKTNPDLINRQIEKFMSLRNQIYVTYMINDKNSSSFSKISSQKELVSKKIQSITENFEIEKDKIGYNVFSENQSGLNTMSANSYIDRFLAEQRKYYPKMESVTDSNSMSRQEISDFKSTKNKASFLTPANLVYGDKKITTSRGVNNINPEDVKKFRIAKSEKARKKNLSRLALKGSSSKLSENTMSNFNLTISEPKRGLIERSINEKIDPLIDSKYYLGESSYFVTSNPDKVLKVFKKINLKNSKKIFDIVSNVIPRKFLKNKKSIKSSSEIKISNKNSITRKLLVDKNIEFKKIPPQIKYIMSESFNNSNSIDPLMNLDVAPIIDETQKNLYIIKALIGFERDEDGIFNLKRPIYKQIDQEEVGSKVMIAKAYDYEVPELGIVKDTFMPTIYNNLLLLGM